MTKEQPLSQEHIFIVRLWCEQQATPETAAQYRGMVQHAATGDKVYLSNITELTQHIAAYLNESHPSP